MPPVKLSVVIITFNEERNIGRCLDAVRSFADDIVVVDSFSTDNTEKICREKGARFIQHKFEGHIQQKNWAITQAQFPHILSLDADEAPDDVLAKEIVSVKANWTHDGYSMNRLTNYCGQWIRHCGWYPDTKLRLWDSTRGAWCGMNPHDRYELSDRKAAVKHLQGDILHFSYYTVEEHRRQVDKFSQIAARAAFERNVSSGYLVAALKCAAKFIRNYIINAGFLDGKFGWTICTIDAKGTWMKYIRLHRMNEEKK